MKKRPDRILSMKYRLFNDGILIMINYNPRATGQYNHQYIKQTRFFKRVGYCMSQSSTINSTPTHYGVVPLDFLAILAASLPLLLSMRWMRRAPNFTEPPWGTQEPSRRYNIFLDCGIHSRNCLPSTSDNFFQLLLLLDRREAPRSEALMTSSTGALTHSSKDRVPKGWRSEVLEQPPSGVELNAGKPVRQRSLNILHCVLMGEVVVDGQGITLDCQFCPWHLLAWISSSFNMQNFGRK